MWEAEATCAATPSQAWQILSDVTAWPEMLPTFDAVEPADNNRDASPGVDAAYVVRQPRLLYSRLTRRYLQTEVTTFARLAESA